MFFNAKVLLLSFLVVFCLTSNYAQTSQSTVSIKVTLNKDKKDRLFYGMSQKKIQEIKNNSGAIAFFYKAKNGKIYLITCAHEIEKAHIYNEIASGVATIEAKVNNETLKLEVVGADTPLDIAVLEYKGQLPKNIKTLEFHSKDVEKNTKVKKILPNKIMEGVINRINFKTKSKFRNPYCISTNIPNEKGHSGSPIILLDGTVVGINVQRMEEWNLAVRSTIAYDAIEEIIQYGRRQRAYLGCVFSEYGRSKSGVTLEGLLESSPATKQLADKIGQQIIRFEEKEIEYLSDLHDALEFIPPNKKVTFTFKNKKTVEIQTGTLQKQHFEEIADYHFEHHAEGEGEGEFAIIECPPTKSSDVFLYSRRYMSKTQKPCRIAGNHGTKITKAGVRDSYGNTYVVRNSMDLGNLIKNFTFDHNGICLYYDNQKNPENIYNKISKAKESVRILYY